MKFEEAVKKSVKMFMEGKMPPKIQEMKAEGRIYTPEYFDNLEERLLGSSEKDTE